MADRSKIEWTDATWSPVTGCTKVSSGCDRCYAERITERFHGKGSFENVVLHEDRLAQPLRWRKPRRVFELGLQRVGMTVAVVPQVAEHIGRLIVAADREPVNP